MLCARTGADVANLAAELGPLCEAGQRVIAQPADVARPEDIDALVKATVEGFGRIDVLVNNAGVYGPLGPLDEIDWAAWSEAVAINLLGTVYACRRVLPVMKRQRYGKIINVSGGGATSPLPRITAYAATKAAVVRFTESLALELRDHRIDVNAIAPGALATRLLDEVIAAGPDAVGADFHARMVKTKADGGTPLARGAELVVFLGSAASDGISGRLISAVWDPWRELPSHRADLDAGDVYTLRRIVPSDRGLNWGGA
jgi:3-oxoacyl-[acyl-carrier protein] reductase